MARTGITQDQVDAAADALLLAGERPTIERVRAHLGTGAPATVIRLLDVWWKALGDRLQAQTIKLQLPEAPSTVAAAASELWLMALKEAKALAAREFEASQVELESSRAELEKEQVQLADRVAAAESRALAAQESEALMRGRFEDLQRLLDQQSGQLKDLHGQRDGIADELRASREALSASQAAHATALTQAASERTQLEVAHRQAEDRWMREVDRARQECERLTSVLRKQEQASQAANKQASDRQTELAKSLRSAERENAKMAGQIAGLEPELERLHGQLRDALALRETGKAVSIRRRRTAKAP